LFLALRLGGLEATHDLCAGRPSAFQAALEGLHAAKLSGFLLCVHARVDAQTDLGEIAQLVELARSLDMDGFVITPAANSPNSALQHHSALQRKTADAIRLIGHPWWESFSRFLEPAFNGGHKVVSGIEAANLHLEQESGASEEGVNVA
jgi:hypothetical protein